MPTMRVTLASPAFRTRALAGLVDIGIVGHHVKWPPQLTTNYAGGGPCEPIPELDDLA
jgi:hypothetical protein